MSVDSNSDSGFEDPKDHDISQVSALTFLPPPPLPRQSYEKTSDPAVPLSGYGHSLLPDMLFGWQPKLVRGGPIPLLFTKAEFPISLHPTTHLPNRVLYHGFRPHNSLILHQAFSGVASYPLPAYTVPVAKTSKPAEWEVDPRPFVGNSPDSLPDDLEFDAFFEGGNLDMVVRSEADEYDLYMRPDANTRGHNQWFYYSVTAPKPCEIRFNILNFTKASSLYTQGMRPLVLDTAGKKGRWTPAGYGLRYRLSKINPYSDRCYYSLSFTYRFSHTEKVYFSYAIPYSYTKLRGFLSELGSVSDLRYKRDTLCRSLSGVDVPLLTITNFSQAIAGKSGIIVTARVHPGETYGSFMMEVGTM